MKNVDLWVVSDGRAGNTNQAIDLADSLEMDYEVKHIEFNALSYLPNFLLSGSAVHIKKSCKESLDYNNLPKYIISSGRRSASVAVFLQNKAKHKIKIIQIMRPQIDSSKFALIILPEHDNAPASDNIFKITGALNNINNKIQANLDDLPSKYKKKSIAVILGGKSGNYVPSIESYSNFLSYLNKMSIEKNLPLHISFSRRTPDSIKKYIQGNLLKGHIIYNPDIDAQNPYPAMLNYAEFIVTTSDSISMCSEAVSTGKPTYIFCDSSFKSSKHWYFVALLFTQKIAIKIDYNRALNKYEYNPLNELARASNKCKELLN